MVSYLIAVVSYIIAASECSMFAVVCCQTNSMLRLIGNLLKRRYYDQSALDEKIELHRHIATALSQHTLKHISLLICIHPVKTFLT